MFQGPDVIEVTCWNLLVQFPFACLVLTIVWMTLVFWKSLKVPVLREELG
jgi:hypothetical protein